MMKKTKNTVLILAMSLVFLCALNCHAEPSNIYVEPAGGFQYVVPNGWTVTEVPGIKYKIVHGSPSDGFAPNINVVDEAYSGAIEDYVNISLGQLQKVFQDFKNLGKTNFTTNTGIKGIKLITESTQGNSRLRQEFYFFNGKGGKKLVVTCSVLAKDGNKFTKLFDDSLKSFDVK